MRRVFDVLAATLLLIFILPILLLAVVFVFMFSPGNPLFLARRCGKGNKEVTVYKLRTLKSQKEGYVPVVGLLFRRLHVDELPQIFNILNGSMSFVGPRPVEVSWTEQFFSLEPLYVERLNISQGIFGYAQNLGLEHTHDGFRDALSEDFRLIQDFKTRHWFGVYMSALRGFIFAKRKRASRGEVTSPLPQRVAA